MANSNVDDIAFLTKASDSLLAAKLRLTNNDDPYSTEWTDY